MASEATFIGNHVRPQMSAIRENAAMRLTPSTCGQACNPQEVILDSCGWWQQENGLTSRRPWRLHRWEISVSEIELRFGQSGFDENLFVRSATRDRPKLGQIRQLESKGAEIELANEFSREGRHGVE